MIEKVKADLVAKRGREAAARDARAALSEVKSGVKLAAVAATYGLKPKTTGYFKRNDAIADIGREAAIANAAFELSDGSRWPEDVVETSRGFYLLEFAGRKAADLSDLDEKREAIQQRLLQQKQYQAIEAWLTNQKEKSEISIEPNFQQG